MTERRKTHFWGYDQHQRSVLDVVDEERWRTEERWAIGESLVYAHMLQRNPVTPSFAHRSFMDSFEAMLNNLLHRPLDLCTATEVVQGTEQVTFEEVTTGES